MHPRWPKSSLCTVVCPKGGMQYKISRCSYYHGGVFCVNVWSKNRHPPDTPSFIQLGVSASSLWKISLFFLCAFLFTTVLIISCPSYSYSNPFFFVPLLCLYVDLRGFISYDFQIWVCSSKLSRVLHHRIGERGCVNIYSIYQVKFKMIFSSRNLW